MCVQHGTVRDNTLYGAIAEGIVSGRIVALGTCTAREAVGRTPECERSCFGHCTDGNFGRIYSKLSSEEPMVHISLSDAPREAGVHGGICLELEDAFLGWMLPKDAPAKLVSDGHEWFRYTALKHYRGELTP
jgi:hypothetical protein